MTTPSPEFAAGEKRRGLPRLLAGLACLFGCLFGCLCGRRREHTDSFCGCMRLRMPDAEAYTAWAKESRPSGPVAPASLAEIRFTSSKVIHHESSNAEYYEAGYSAHCTDATGRQR